MKNLLIAVTLPVWWPLDVLAGAVALALAPKARFTKWYIYGDWREAGSGLNSSEGKTC